MYPACQGSFYYIPSTFEDNVRGKRVHYRYSDALQSSFLCNVDRCRQNDVRNSCNTFPFSVIPRRAVGIPNKSWLFNHIMS